MSQWNFSTVWRTVGVTIPEASAIEQGDRTVTWGEFHRASEGGASWLMDHDVAPNAKVALYLYNSPEYLMGFAMSVAARCVPMNTNYRYEADELAYLFENGDAEVVIFHGTFTPMVDAIRGRCPLLRHFVYVADGSGECPAWAVPFEELSLHPVRELPEASPDDLLFLFTGGTTGMPKGVMWRNDDLFSRMNNGSFRRLPPEGDRTDVVTLLQAEGPGIAVLPACPLMHGTGLFSAINSLSTGGRVVLLPSRKFDARELARVIDQHQVQVAVIVGDPFARPLAKVVSESPQDFSLSSLFCILSSGAMWSTEIKEALLAHHSAMMLVDAFSSSEALGMGSSVSTANGTETTARFNLGENVRVVDDNDRDVVPGSDSVGRIMLGGRIPMGYYKDEKKTAATFQTHDGVRYSVPGDMAMVNADGTIHLLGRGSQCINTAGEKVFPEEVEEALKTHEAVADACVLGTPHETFGQQIVAAVELHAGATVSESELIAYVKTRLSSYKAPRHVRFVDTIGRAVNGKMDVARHQREAREWLETIS